MSILTIQERSWALEFWEDIFAVLSGFSLSHRYLDYICLRVGIICCAKVMWVPWGYGEKHLGDVVLVSCSRRQLENEV